MSSPTVNVCGVSLPGAPGVVIGFNKNISWGVTNVDADVMDWYQVKFKDKSKSEYWFNNTWNKTTRRIEVINIKGTKNQRLIRLYTHITVRWFTIMLRRNLEDDHENIPVGDALRMDSPR